MYFVTLFYKVYGNNNIVNIYLSIFFMCFVMFCYFISFSNTIITALCELNLLKTIVKEKNNFEQNNILLCSKLTFFYLYIFYSNHENLIFTYLYITHIFYLSLIIYFIIFISSIP
ncbi:hypothetical protein CF049_04595 [Clostridium sporogenes]|nr:hypothetical protein RSJ11_08330 [Clostridium sporogenes]AVQ52593.1 hypothetical protein C7M59_06875 [Clostridium botulinum]